MIITIRIVLLIIVIIVIVKIGIVILVIVKIIVLVTNNVINRLIDDNSVNISSNFLNNECVNIYVT